MSFDSIPNEVMINIIKFLDIKTFNTLKSVNRRMLELCKYIENKNILLDDGTTIKCYPFEDTPSGTYNISYSRGHPWTFQYTPDFNITISELYNL